MKSRKKQSSHSDASKVEQIAIVDIRMDGGTQPRARLDDETIDAYVQGLKEGAIYPPVTIYYDGTDYWLADGFHRVKSNEKAGNTAINAEIISGTKRDAVLFSVGANATHGLRRSNADKRRAVETLLRDEEWQAWSDRAISSQCNVSHTLVSQVRHDLFGSDATEQEAIPTERIAKRGDTTYVVKTKKIGQRENQESTSSARRRKKAEPEPIPEPIIIKAKPVKKGDVWQLGDQHLLYCGGQSTPKFQSLLPEDIALLLVFPTCPNEWISTIPTQARSVLALYTPYGDDMHLETLRTVVSSYVSGTTDGGDIVFMLGLPDPSLFLLMEEMECQCRCAEPNPERCTDALAAWSVTQKPAIRI
ncbi:MAG: streptomycin biosynthesis regulator [Thermosynechococcaceae cyanobacterium]